MALRQLQIVIHEDRRALLDGLIEGSGAVRDFAVSAGDGLVLVGVTIRMESVEALTDSILAHHKHDKGFRLSILSVEATHPKLPEPEEEAKQDPEKKWSPRFGRVSREELVEDIEGSAKTTPVSLIMVVLATVVACVGLLKDSPAVIIGAMVIAPLLGPNIALALGTTLGDLVMVRRAIRSNIIGLSIAISISVLVGLTLARGEGTSEITARTMVDLGDVLLALASGAAGAVAFTSGAPQVVVGVMVAVALLPPTSVCGMMIGRGDWLDAADSALLTATNVTCINLSATGVFLVQGIRPSAWWEKGRARGASIRAMVMWSVALVILAVLIVLSGFGSS